MGKKLSPETLEAFFDLDRIMNREGLDGPDLNKWFELCAAVSDSLSGPSDAGATGGRFEGSDELSGKN